MNFDEMTSCVILTTEELEAFGVALAEVLSDGCDTEITVPKTSPNDD
jgi:hypothetical protein